MIAQQPVFSLISLTGLYSYQVWCFFKSRKEELEFEKKLSANEFRSIEITKLVFPKATFFDISLKLPLPKIMDKGLRISKTDVAIMKHMAQGHGRDSFYQMSKDLNILYDSVHYHGKNLLQSGYFLAIIAQPGTNQFTLQTTSLLISCKSAKASQKLYDLLQKTPHVISDAIGKKNRILVHFLSQTHAEYRKTLSMILSLIPQEEINEVLITYWDDVVLNNRYPLEYFIK